MAILTHNQMRELLKGTAGKQFVDGTVNNFVPYDVPYSNIRYLMLSEFTVRYYNKDNVQRGRKGYIKADEDRRFDALLFVRPGEKSIARGFTYTIGIELKGDKGDLKRDDKIQRYVGWVDFMYIGVPDELADDAITKVETLSNEHPEVKGLIGVFGVRTGQIYKCPAKKSAVVTEYGLAVYSQAVNNYILHGSETVSFDCEDIESLPVPDYSPKEQKPVKQPENKPEGNSSHGLTDEEKAVRRAERQRNKERIEQQRREIQVKQEVLMPQTREKLAGLNERDNVVFWAIRDGQSAGGVKGTNIIEKTGQSARSVTRSIATLRSAGLIALDGSMRTGLFKVVGDAARDSRCMTCQLRERCQGNSLLCGTYQPLRQVPSSSQV